MERPSELRQAATASASRRLASATLKLRFVSVLLDGLGSEDGVQPALVLRLLLRHLPARQPREDAPVAQLLLPHNFASLQLYLGNQPKGLGPPMRKPERLEPSREAAAEGRHPTIPERRTLSTDPPTLALIDSPSWLLPSARFLPSFQILPSAQICLTM